MTKSSIPAADPRLIPWRHGFPLVDGLPDASRARLAAIGGTAEFAGGEVVLPEGVPTPFLATVVSGRLALRLHVPERGARTILTLEAGDVLGWSALVPPHRTTSLTVALEPTVIATLEAERLRVLLAEDRDLAAAIYPAVVAVVAERLAASRQQLLDLFSGSGDEPW